MRLKPKSALILKLFLATLVVTILFLLGGFLVTREIGRYERQRFMMRPLMDYADTVDRMVDEGIEQKRAMHILRRSMPPHFAEQLIWKPNRPEHKGPHPFVQLRSGGVIEMSPPRGGGHRGPPPMGMMMGVGPGIALISLIGGLACSFIIIVFVLRRKARAAEKVINELEQGQLSARLPIDSTDEFTGLAEKFNSMAQSIQQLVSRLRETELARRSLLSELAHDLRTPVAAMRSSAEILDGNWQRLTEEKRNEMLRLHLRETEYFQRLVDELLFISGVDDPRFGQEFADVKLSELCDQVAGNLADGRLLLQIEKGIVIKGDAHLLERMLINIMSNATRFADKNITVKLWQDGQRVLLQVVDDGKGLTEQELQDYGRRKFSRHWSEESGGHLSLGLGSVVVGRVAELHQAELHVSNGVNGGAVIQLAFHLPSIKKS